MQKACILRIYPSKNEHSVFRGVTIQTLRKLGLIIGRNDKLRLTLNAEIIVAPKDEALSQRTTRAVFLEIDYDKFHIIQAIIDGLVNTSTLLTHFSERSKLTNKQLNERITSWVGILKNIGLIRQDNSRNYSLDEEVINQAQLDLKINDIKGSQFVKTLLKTFPSLNDYGASGMVDIDEMRSKVGLEYLNNKIILTKRQFDELLRKSPKITNEYIITFGQPMGSEEQLFEYRGKYYRTINIKALKRDTKNDELYGEYLRA